MDLRFVGIGWEPEFTEVIQGHESELVLACAKSLSLLEPTTSLSGDIGAEKGWVSQECGFMGAHWNCLWP